MTSVAGADCTRSMNVEDCVSRSDLDAEQDNKSVSCGSSTKKNSNSSNNSQVCLQPPRKPLSAYNFFFQDERAKILGSETIEEEHEDPRERKKRRHRKTHGKIGFTQLAKHVGQKWKKLDAETRALYVARFQADKKRYAKELAEYEDRLSNMIHLAQVKKALQTLRAQEAEKKKVADRIAAEELELLELQESRKRKAKAMEFNALSNANSEGSILAQDYSFENVLSTAIRMTNFPLNIQEVSAGIKRARGMACNDLSDYPNALFGLHSQALPMNYSNSLLNATNASSFTAMQLSSLSAMNAMNHMNLMGRPGSIFPPDICKPTLINYPMHVPSEDHVKAKMKAHIEKQQQELNLLRQQLLQHQQQSNNSNCSRRPNSGLLVTAADVHNIVTPEDSPRNPHASALLHDFDSEESVPFMPVSEADLKLQQVEAEIDDGFERMLQQMSDPVQDCTSPKPNSPCDEANFDSFDIQMDDSHDDVDSDGDVDDHWASAAEMHDPLALTDHQASDEHLGFLREYIYD